MTLSTPIAARILSARAPEEIFTSPVTAREEYRQLSRLFHPDKNADADPGVFAALSSLWERAEAKIAENRWEPPGTMIFEDRDGHRYRLHFLRRTAFELGEVLIGRERVFYLMSRDHLDLAENAARRLAALDFAGDTMRAEMERRLPQGAHLHRGKDRLLMVVNKPASAVGLRDLLTLNKGRLEPVHAAWVISRLYSFACYLRWSKIVHHDVSPDSLFLTPEDHGVQLLGGWWYARERGARLLALPGRTMNLVPSRLLAPRMADPQVDAELVKAAGREILGDVHGSRLIADKAVPGPLRDWLLAPAGPDPFADFETYQKKVLVDSFGPRRFVKLDVTFDHVYGKP